MLSGDPATEHAAAKARVPLDMLLRPRSVAVVGASPVRGKPGGRVLAYLREIGFGGAIFPVNPRHKEIGGLRTYPSLVAIGADVDLAVLIIPAAAVSATLDDAVTSGVRAIVVCSSGFAEAGPVGAELERQMVDTVQRHGLTVLGPNSLGFYDARRRVAATFSTALQLDQSDHSSSGGRIAFVSQSGALGAGLFALGRQRGVELAMFVSTGNEATLSIADLLHHLVDDDDLSTFLCYIEGCDDGRRFVEAARMAHRRGKRVATIKVGRTIASGRAAESHTGALVGSNLVWEAAFRRSGVLSCRDADDLLDAACALDLCGASRNRAVGVVSMSGGAGALIADRLVESGLDVPLLAASTQDALAQVLPTYASMTNPVDYGAVYGDIEAIGRTVDIVVTDDGIGAVLVFVGLTPGHVGHLEQRLIAEAERSPVPLVVAWLGAPDSSLRQLRAGGVPAYGHVSGAVVAAAALAEGTAELPPDPAINDADRAAAAAALAELEKEARHRVAERPMKAFLQRWGLPVSAEHFAATAAEAMSAAAALGGNVAVKVDAAGLLHKSEIGGIALGVATEGASAAFDAVVAAGRDAGYQVSGAVVAPMAAPGLELIIGGRWDEQFGATILVGAGGVTSEIADDARVELAPVAYEQATEMLMSLRLSPLLRGYRGGPELDVDAVATVIVEVSRLVAASEGRLTELDLNPVVVYPKKEGCMILDAAGVIAQP